MRLAVGRWLAIVGISLCAAGVLALARPGNEVTLLVYLPGIVVAAALFGPRAGVAAVIISVASSVVYRAWLAPWRVRLLLPGLIEPWSHELVLLLVGLFVVLLMELRRRSGQREALGAQQLAAVLDHVSEAVVMFDRRLVVISMNRAAYDLLQRPGATLVGESAAALRERFQFNGEPGVGHPELEDVMRSGRTLRLQGTILDVAQRRRIQVLVAAVPWRGVRRQIEGVIVLVSDITAIKELQMRALDSARQAAVAQMASGLSHDFNHVLDIIRRAVAVLAAQTAEHGEHQRYLEMVDRAAVEGSQIVRRLRNYLADGGGATEPVDMAAVAHEAVELTRPLWRTLPGLEVREEIAPVALVEGNAHDLQRVLVNLIFNAIEAIGTHPGTIVVRTAEGGDPPVVSAVVEDTGPGIAPEARDRIFEPYFTTKPHGLGLGLFGARKIAEAHHASLDLVSQPGSGTRFTLQMPARKAA